MRQKMINLCPATHDIAMKMSNFSEWVRNQIKEYAFEEVETYLHKCPLGCQKVTEYSNSPMCPQHQARMKLVPSIQLKLL